MTTQVKHTMLKLSTLLQKMIEDGSKKYYCKSWEIEEDPEGNYFDVSNIDAWIDTIKDNEDINLLPDIFMQVANDIWEQV